MNYEEFNRLYREIYQERFRPINQYCYLEEVYYALRKKVINYENR